MTRLLEDGSVADLGCEGTGEVGARLGRPRSAVAASPERCRSASRIQDSRGNHVHDNGSLPGHRCPQNRRLRRVELRIPPRRGMGSPGYDSSSRPHSGSNPPGDHSSPSGFPCTIRVVPTFRQTVGVREFHHTWDYSCDVVDGTDRLSIVRDVSIGNVVSNLINPCREPVIRSFLTNPPGIDGSQQDADRPDNGHALVFRKRPGISVVCQ
jgi:hypothetical protein